jgi:ribosome-associated translation inhibitor RaiA
MNIKISAQGLRLEAATDVFVREQIFSALQRFEEQVVSVDAFLKDINGPKGGIDKQVLIRIRLRNRQVIATEITRANLRAAVVVVTRKARRAVRRSLKKSQQRHRWRISAGLTEATES